MSKEEIRTKWIRHTPLMKLDECVDNAMQEYSDQNTKPLIDEITELRKQYEQSDKMYSDLLAKKDDFKLKWENAENEIADLKSQLLLSEQKVKLNYNCAIEASKSEANEVVEFAEWCATSEYVLTDFDNKKWLNFNDIEKPMKTTTKLYEIFKTRNNK